MMLLWLAIIFVLFYLLLGGKLDINQFKSKNASSFLDERLARGEISISEYKQLKSILKESK
jgi:uncharacterized membrane protein